MKGVSESNGGVSLDGVLAVVHLTLHLSRKDSVRSNGGLPASLDFPAHCRSPQQ